MVTRQRRKKTGNGRNLTEDWTFPSSLPCLENRAVQADPFGPLLSRSDQRTVGEMSPPSIVRTVGLNSKLAEKPAHLLRQVNVKQPHSARPESPPRLASLLGSPREETVRRFPRFPRRSSPRTGTTK